MEEQRATATTINRSKALDCTHANAKTVLGYYRSNTLISLPANKYLMFFHWIRYKLFYEAKTIEEVVSDRHTAEWDGKKVYFRCDFYEKEKKHGEHNV